MTVYVHEHQNADLNNMVLHDLQTVCADRSLVVDLSPQMVTNPTDPDAGQYLRRGTGRVYILKPSATASIGSQYLYSLISNEAWVLTIRGENTSYPTDKGKTLQDSAGVTNPPKTIGNKVHIMIIYDPTTCTTGTTRRGYFVVGQDFSAIDMPGHVILFHEMVHALNKFKGTQDPKEPEKQAAVAENLYRQERNLPLRTTSDLLHHTGACNPLPDAPPPKSDCFIATAAYGSTIEDEVEFLRRFRDDLLMKTRSGAQFFQHFYDQYYYQFSPPIADQMRADPEMAAQVRFALVEPIVHYLQWFVLMPHGPLDGVPEPWASFLAGMRDTMQTWTDQLDRPHSFEGMPVDEAVREISIFLRFVLGSPERRNTYLQELKQQYCIPLTASSYSEYDKSLKYLQEAECSQEEMQQMLKAPPQTQHSAFPVSHAALGTQEDVDIAGVNPSEWFYTVTITNATDQTTSPATFAEVVLFYNRVNLPGVVFLVQEQVQPGQTIVFILGVCSQMQSYTWGFRYLADKDGVLQEVWQKVDDNGQAFTATTRNDPMPCEDSFIIGP
jgi:hypothetical protein